MLPRGWAASCWLALALGCSGAPHEAVSAPAAAGSSSVALEPAPPKPPPRPPTASELRPPASDPPTYSPAALMEHVRQLTSEKMAGRRSASADERTAAAYVVAELSAAKVGPLAGELREQAFTLPKKTPQGETESINVFGLVSGGSSTLSREMIVVGTHIDHVGVDGGKLHPGAEDNASGVAVALELAATLAARPQRLGRSVLFVFFGAEEIGLLGSRAFVKAPPPPVKLADVAAMVNIDMIGRPLADRAAFLLGKRALGIDSERSVGVIGTKGRPKMRKMVDDACAAAGIRAVAPEDLPKPLASFVEKQAEARGDNWSFERAGVAALFFSSGESDGYHQPTDVPENLTPEIMAQRAFAIHRVIEALSTAERASLKP